MLIRRRCYLGDYTLPLVEVLCQVAMGYIPALEYLHYCAHLGLWPRPIIPGSKCRRFPRPRCAVKNLCDTGSS
jgi:hypothetical protein